MITRSAITRSEADAEAKVCDVRSASACLSSTRRMW